MADVSHRQCFVALGANLPTATGTPIDTLNCALKLISRESLCPVLFSGWYQSPAFPAGSGPDFVNGVAKICTHKPALDVIEILHAIEKRLGRTRHSRWEARVCDLDLIAYADHVVPSHEVFDHWQTLPTDQQRTHSPDQLILPHPRMQDRAFVLVPMLEIAPDWVHPRTAKTIREMINILPKSDLDGIQPITS